MINFLQTTEGAVTTACVYVLIGFGWNLVYNACGYLNLAIGEFYILGAILGVKFHDALGIHSILLCGILSIVALGALGFLSEIVLLRRVSTTTYRPLIVTLGLALVLFQLASVLSPGVVIHPDPVLAGPPIDAGGVLIPRQDVFVWGISVLVVVGLIYFFQRTDLGRRVRAAVDAPSAARLLGMRVQWYMTGAFTAGAMLAALAAFAVAPTQGVNYQQGDIIAITSFLAVAIGGLGNYRGGVIGAFAVALVSGYVARYWSPNAAQVLVYVGFLIVLLIQAERGFGWLPFRDALRRVRWSARRRPYTP
jgi:branched-chain amino acid transport system permease protein